MKEKCAKVINSNSRTLAAFCMFFLLGLAAAIMPKSLSASLNLLVWLLFGLVLSFAVLFKRKTARFALGCLFAFTLGVWRYGVAFPMTDSGYIHAYAGNRVALIGYIAAEPDVRLSEVRYILRVEQTALAAKPGDDSRPRPDFVGAAAGKLKFDFKPTVKDKVFFKTELYPRYEYGDRVIVECRLKRPEPIVDQETGKIFAYDKYLARFGVFTVCESNPSRGWWPAVRKISEGRGNFFKLRLLNFKSRLADRVGALWPEPHASFMAGLLYGYRGGLGELQEMFSLTGVTHIVAISGYNITIIATILITACTYLYIPRPKAFWLVVAGIALFVIFTGASASVVRAGIMGIITLLARQLGRPSRAGNVLLLAAVIMNLHNPLVLMYDAGFQLSFLSTLGLVYLSPVFEPRLKWLPETLGLRESFTATLSAIAATLPLILYQFGRLSIVAPLVNILILWLIPWLMMLGALALAASFVFWPAAQVVAGLAWAGLEYIIKTVSWFARLPFAAIDARLPLGAVVAAYCAMIYAVKKLMPTKPEPS